MKAHFDGAFDEVKQAAHRVETSVTLNAESFYINHGNQKGFKFEIIINVSVSCFSFITIPVLWVHGHHK